MVDEKFNGQLTQGGEQTFALPTTTNVLTFSGSFLFSTLPGGSYTQSNNAQGAERRFF